MYAIIETGGKQYRVQKDDVFKVEKLNAEVGDTVTFDKVVAVGGDKFAVGTPYVEGCGVTAEVLEQGKNDKVIIYKYKAKKDSRTKNGHRQPYTLVKVTGIGDSAEKPASKPEAKTDTAENETVNVSMSMKKDELLEAAKKAGVEVSSKDTKQEIIDAINAAK